MKTLSSSQSLLLDLHHHLHMSAHACLHSSLPPSLHPAPRRRSRISSSSSSPPIRRPSDRFAAGNGGALSPPRTSPPRSDSPAVSELNLFLNLVPWRMRGHLCEHEEIKDLIEVVMDLGRKPIARFPSGDWVISDEPVKVEDLRHSVSKVGEFSDDNRSGINHSLHRISAIRNRKMHIIGLTCRVGRAISGSAGMIRDLIEGGGSILVIGPPGVGKTTLIREIARMLADEHMKRVVIVDTSNEIGGDGDVPHSGIGRARRMQVPNVNMQHNVMIEAVENHMPETIIIDEIGTELEAMAASTIAQRGVQLVGTAHGITIENIVKNPSLQILVGGIESVTLGDDEARKRKVQKTILERKGPPTFSCAVEMISKTECRVHHRLDATVDAILAGKTPLFEVRHMDANDVNARISAKATLVAEGKTGGFVSTTSDYKEAKRGSIEDDIDVSVDSRKKWRSDRSVDNKRPIHVYTYKILDVDLLQVVQVMGLESEIDVTDNILMADAILVSNSELKQNSWIRGVAKFHHLPIVVMKTNSMAQIVKALRMILGSNPFESAFGRPFHHSAKDVEIEDDAPKRKPSLEEMDALEEARLAIEYIVIPGGEPVELLPRCSEIIARQLELVESYQLAAEQSGTGLFPRLQILPQKVRKASVSSSCSGRGKSDLHLNSLTDGGRGNSVARLPILPDHQI